MAGRKSAGGPGPFAGFSPASFRFFRQLARNNHKPWFDRNRPVYEEQVAGALKRLFGALLPVVRKLSPEFEVSGRSGRNFSRINRDIRFARDKSPYRRNLYLFFGARSDGQLGTRLYVGISAEGVTCGFAAYNGRESSLHRILKPRRACHPERLERWIRRLGRRFEMYWHGVERGEWRKYPGAPREERDWKRCRAWIVRARFSPRRRELRSARFARRVESIFRDLFPLFAFAALEGRAAERALVRDS